MSARAGKPPGRCRSHRCRYSQRYISRSAPGWPRPVRQSPYLSTGDAQGCGTCHRQTADFTALESFKYECDQINFDFHIRYKQLDLWARFQDFQTRIRDAIIKRQSLDFIMAGFNGIERAATSDRKKYPLLQDVAIGWLQKYRNEAPARVMSKITDEDGKVISDVIRVGKNGDYANLDALVMDATGNLIDEIYQDDPELVVITGRKLMADKYFPIVNKEQENTESLAADIIISQKRIGNLPAVRVPYFPANALMVTRLDNLSIYFMDDAHRRSIIENPKKDRIENYESMNVDYVVEAYAAGCLIENIKLGDFTAPAAPESGE
nr:MAG TPA: major capsid protein [Caudoviricetes sp.]